MKKLVEVEFVIFVGWVSIDGPLDIRLWDFVFAIEVHQELVGFSCIELIVLIFGVFEEYFFQKVLSFGLIVIWVQKLVDIEFFVFDSIIILKTFKNRR